jgi:hypothetical protein
MNLNLTDLPQQLRRQRIPPRIASCPVDRGGGDPKCSTEGAGHQRPGSSADIPRGRGRKMTNDPMRQEIVALLRPCRDGWSAEHWHALATLP